MPCKMTSARDVAVHSDTQPRGPACHVRAKTILGFLVEPPDGFDEPDRIIQENQCEIFHVRLFLKNRILYPISLLLESSYYFCKFRMILYENSVLCVYFFCIDL